MGISNGWLDSRKSNMNAELKVNIRHTIYGVEKNKRQSQLKPYPCSLTDGWNYLNNIKKNSLPQ